MASIILRFVRPEHYGIISPPVERILDVRHGSDAVETYLGYIENLRAVQLHYGFRRAAEADMALWVLHERIFGKNRDLKIKRIYETDEFLLALRAKNLVSPIAMLPLPRLAQALAQTNPILAGVIACHTFELLVREVATKTGSASLEKLSDVIHMLHRREFITSAKRVQWTNLKRIRDAVFHDGYEPSPGELGELIEEVVRLCGIAE